MNPSKMWTIFKNVAFTLWYSGVFIEQKDVQNSYGFLEENDGSKMVGFPLHVYVDIYPWETDLFGFWGNVTQS